MDTVVLTLAILGVSALCRKLILDEIEIYGGDKNLTKRIHTQDSTGLVWVVIYVLAIPYQLLIIIKRRLRL